MNDAVQRKIWLCADDYGISSAVNGAIRNLVVRGRLNATSVMVAAPAFSRSEAVALEMLNSGTSRRVAIGLHVTLTAPFRPLSAGFRPQRGGAFLPLKEMLLRGALHLLQRRALAVEIASQFQAFVTAFGRAPDFVDGHQHVHLFPQIRDAVLDVVTAVAPNAWVRQCGSARRRSGDYKAMVLDRLSGSFRRRAGTYDFNASDNPDYAAMFKGFFAGLPAGSVVMCHPGMVDNELVRLDPLTTLREREYAFLTDDAFPALLQASGVALA